MCNLVIPYSLFHVFLKKKQIFLYNLNKYISLNYNVLIYVIFSWRINNELQFIRQNSLRI
jgi:hypothetical protein